MKIHELQNHFKHDFPLEESILLHTICGICFHDHLKNKIDNRYEERKKDFFQAYKNSTNYKKHFFHNFPSVDEIRIIKLYSMYEWEENNKVGSGKELLMKYILDGYKRIHDYVHRQRYFSVDNFLDFIIERSPEPIPETVHTFLTCIAFFIAGPDKEIIPMSEEPVVRTVLYNMNLFHADISLDKTFAQEKEKIGTEPLKKFHEITGSKYKRNDLIDTIFSNHENHLIKFLTNAEKKEIFKKGIYKNLYNKGLLRYWKSLTSILRLNNINDMNYANIPFTRDDLDYIYTIFEISKKQDRLKEEDFEFFLVASMIILMMTKHYLSLRESHYFLFEIDSGIEEIRHEENYKEQLINFSEKEKEKKAEISYLQEKIKAQEKIIEEQQTIIKGFEQNKNEFTQLKKEVIHLREYVFSQEQLDELPPENIQIKLEENIQILNDKKIAVIGGHQNWHQKIKEILPNIRTVHPDELSVNLNFLKNMDIVCIETSYNNHSLYRKALSNLDKTNINLVYLNQTINIDQFIDKLLKSL